MDGVLVVCGVSHQTATLATRERVSLGEADTRAVLRRLGADRRIRAAVVVSTCNRTELYAAAADAADGEAALREALERHSRAGAAALACATYVLVDDAATEHLFRVVAGLDSAVLGETEIVGQVRAAVLRAEHEAMVDDLLREAFHHALLAGRRVRRSTAIGQGSTSLATVVARSAIACQQDRGVLLIGAGRLIRSVAGALHGHGASGVLIANRTPAVAVDLAEAVGGEALGLHQLDDALARADVVITATGAPQPILTLDRLQALAPASRPRAVFDLAVPRDVEPSAAALPGLALEDIERIQARVELNVAARQRDLERAGAQVRREVARFGAWRRERLVSPALRAVWRRAEELRQQELSRFESLEPGELERLDLATAALVRKILDGPTKRLRAATATTGAPHLQVFRELFDVGDEPAVAALRLLPAERRDVA